MKKIKISLFAVAAILLGIAGSAFTTAGKKSTFLSIYELQSGGNKLNRTDWIPAADDPNCPTTFNSVPCRIQADDASGHPSVASFNNVLSNSSNFTTAYPARVTYKP